MWIYGFVVLCPRAHEGSPAVVLILKHLSRRAHGLKSHLTDWEKPGINPATPGLQDIGLLTCILLGLWHVRHCNIVSGYLFVLY